jgi:hypothetical protein
MDEVGCMVHFKFSIFMVLDPCALDAKFDLEVDDGDEDNNLDISQDEDEKEIENDEESKKNEDEDDEENIKDDKNDYQTQYWCKK